MCCNYQLNYFYLITKQLLEKTIKMISIQNDGILERPILGPYELLAVKNHKEKWK